MCWKQKGLAFSVKTSKNFISFKYSVLALMPKAEAKKGARLSTMWKKKRGLVMNSQNIIKIYIIENKVVSHAMRGEGCEKKGVKNQVKLP